MIKSNKMKNKKYKIQPARNILSSGSQLLLGALLLCAGFFLNSCQKEEEIVISMGEPIALSVSDSILVLSQKQAESNALNINWTRGTNRGTGSSMAYTLEIDKAGNNFSSAKSYTMGKGVFEKSFTVRSLNQLVREEWAIADGVASSFEARVFANITMEGVDDDTTEVKTFSVTPYKPVSEVLYMVGDATPAGWDIAAATQLTALSSTPWVFIYQGQLSSGNFKFAVSQEDCWCQDFYTKDPTSEGMIVYNEGGSGDDIQWNLEEGGNYKLTVNLLDLTIQIDKLEGAAYSNLYIVGDASPSGWNIGDPEAFTKNPDDPFIFTYEAHLSPGDFKISTFAGDWCDGDWLNPSQADQVLTATDFIVTTGCDGPDNKWRVTAETAGRYKITVNLFNSTIKIVPVNLYLVGDGGPNGWNINNPEPLAFADGVYTFTGELGADNPTGEFKIAKFKGDWCDGDWINPASPNQSVTNSSFIVTKGCDGPDNKWKLQDGDAGTYVITINLDTEEMMITKQ